jgi:D-aminopeptidase
MARTVEIDGLRLDAIFAELDQSQRPGAAVGIALGGKPVYRRGFGLANMELPLAVGPAMRMRIGSTSKHFTSLAYLLLCEAGQADIDDPIVTYLPELHPVTHTITMRQLMGHLSGLRDAHEIAWQFSGSHQPVSSRELLSLYRDLGDVNTAPGTAWSYNNGGYLILSAVIERITGQPLEDVLRVRIFEPVGMFDTLLRRRDSDFVPNSATLHATNAAGEYEKSYLGTALAGEGGVVSTVDDMLRWLAHMDAPKLGSAATWRTLKSSQILRNGTSTGYGLGLINGEYRGIETLFHGGGVLGGNSQMLKVPAAALDVVIISNRDDVSSALFANRILDACIPDLEPVNSMVSGSFARGIFHSVSSGRVIQLLEKDGQQIVSIDGFDWPFVRHPDGVLRPAAIWSFIKQTVTLVGDQEQPESVRFDDFGNLDELPAVRPSVRSDGNEIAGRYRCESTCTEAEISRKGDATHVTMHGPFGVMAYPLECLADGIWLAKSGKAIPWNAVLSFDSVEHAFRFSSLRTRGLSFRLVSRPSI